MKKIIFVLLIVLLFASCSKKIEESYFVPKDAIGVMYVNLKSLSEKSKDLDFNQLNINTLIEDKAPKEIKRFVQELLSKDNLDKTFRKEYILGFGTFKRLSGVGGLILPIKDAASFEAFIQPMIDEVPNLEKETNVGKDQEFTIYANKEIAIGWNGKTALIIGANNYAAAELKDLTTLKRENCILATNYFDAFFDTKQDMGLHITSTPLGDAFDGLLNTFAGLDVNLENNNLSYYGSFEQDHIYTKTNLKLNIDFKSLIGYKKWMSTSYDKSMLNALPDNPLLFAKLSIDPENLYEHILSLQDNKTLPIQAREELRKNIKNSNNETEKELGMDVKSFSKIFDGSLMFAMTEGKSIKDTIYDYNYFTDEETYEVVDKKTPNMYGTVALKDKNKFDQFFSIVKKKGAQIETLNSNYFKIDGSTFMVITEDYIFFTNDQSKADEISSNGKLANNLSDFKHKDKLSHSVYLYTKGNIAELSNDFTKSLGNMYNPYSSYNRYGNDTAMDEISEKSSEIYTKYYGENHYFIDTDGGESFTYTKGNKNSLIQTILYGDEVAKTMSTIYENNNKDEDEDEIEIEETVIESTESN